MNRSPSLSAKRVASPNLSAFRRWVLAFCVIRFDLEQGQTVEDCYPPDSLPPDQQLFVAFSSFPDSMSHHHPRHRSSIHDSIFSFRFPAAGAGSFIYGYVFNRQRQDARLPRGGEQNSVVVLSHYPYSSVFRPLLQILGPLCFDIGRAALDLVASHVAAWPPPFPGSPMDLPIGSSALRVHLPPFPDHLAAAPFPPSQPLRPPRPLPRRRPLRRLPRPSPPPLDPLGAHARWRAHPRRRPHPSPVLRGRRRPRQPRRPSTLQRRLPPLLHYPRPRLRPPQFPPRGRQLPSHGPRCHQSILLEVPHEHPSRHLGRESEP